MDEWRMVKYGGKVRRRSTVEEGLVEGRWWKVDNERIFRRNGVGNVESCRLTAAIGRGNGEGDGDREEVLSEFLLYGGK